MRNLVLPDIVPLFFMLTIKLQCIERVTYDFTSGVLNNLCQHGWSKSVDESFIGSGWAWQFEAAKYDKYSEGYRPIIARRHSIRPIRGDNVSHRVKVRS